MVQVDFYFAPIIFSAILSTASVQAENLNSGNSLQEEESPTDNMHNYRPMTKRISQGILEFEDAAHWEKEAQDTLAGKLKSAKIEKEAKNTVFFLGDGMSLPTVTASRIYKGQMEGSNLGGEEASLFFEQFPHIGISKTYCTDSQVADSACSATAYLSGIKANIATIGVKPNVKYDDCKAQMIKDNQVQSVLAWAQAEGKSTGVITTTRITHASPAGAYAHIANRDWENDQVIKSSGSDPNNCDDIAEQLVLNDPGKKINVIFGGGRREFIPNTEFDPELTTTKGKRGDGVNLINKWVEGKADEKARAKYVWNKKDFEAIRPEDTDFVLGLFNYDHLDYVLDDNSTDPSLPELVEKAIAILKRNPKGFFLFVEGGRIDHAHHDTKAQKAFVETITFDKAVKKAADLTNIQDTLILVTSDHAHTMSISGYPARGNPLLELSGFLGDDKLPYTTISYANGPGYKHPTNTGERYDLTKDDLKGKDYMQMTGVPLYSETHGGDDVMIFSQGPFSHLLTGVVQQSYIPHVVGYASCTGYGLRFCQIPEESTSVSTSTTEDFSTSTTPESTTASSTHTCAGFTLVLSAFFVNFKLNFL